MKFSKLSFMSKFDFIHSKVKIYHWYISNQFLWLKCHQREFSLWKEKLLNFELASLTKILYLNRKHAYLRFCLSINCNCLIMQWETLTWSNFTWYFHLIESSNNGILGFKNFWSSAKKEPTDFGSWSNVLLAKK